MKTSYERVSDYINLKTFVVLLTVALFLLPVRPHFTNWLNDLVFPLGISLSKPSILSSGLAIVEVPTETMEKLYRSPGSSLDIFRLLKRMTDSEGVTICVVLERGVNDQRKLLALLQLGLNDQKEHSELNVSEELAEEPDEELDEELDEQTALSYLTTRDGLTVLFAKPQVFSNQASSFNTSVSYSEENFSQAFYWQWMPSWLLVSPPVKDSLLVSPYGPQSEAGRHQYLLFQSDEGMQASLALAMFNRHVNNIDMEWQGRNLLRLGDVQLKVTADGSFLPGLNSGAAENKIKRFSLEEAKNIRLGENLVLLGAKGSPQLESLATTLLSLQNEEYFYTPPWFYLLEIILASLLLIFLLMLVPRMSIAVGSLSTFLLVFVMIVAQLGWQITQNQYLPLGLLIQYLLLAFVLMIIWRKQSDKITALQAAAHGARYQLALQLFRDGRSDDALLAIKECYPSDAVLTLMYDIASQQERKRHYGEAVKTYAAITERSKNYKDVGEKIEKLIAYSSGATSSLGAGGDIATTLLVSESTIHKPVLGRYEIERELGRGAMGIVYLGRDPKISRQVAIKTLSYMQIDPQEINEFKERFFREAEAAGRLSHPNIVTIYDVGEEHDLAFIAMDYVKGGVLSDYVAADNLLPIKNVCQIVSEVADALDYAHRQNIIHRDIKPSNILYRADTEEVKVTDFGVARIVDSSRTNTGDILGSPLYMSPEQLKGEKVSEQSDIYSLGVTFYQLLSGELPFNGENIANLTYNIIHQKYKAIRDIRPVLPVGLTRIVNKALHKDPSKRYTSGSEFSKAIKKILGSL